MKPHFLGKTVEIIGVPLDLGANIRGATMGPDAIRIANLHQKIHHLGYDILDSGNLNIPVRETIDETNAKSHYLPEIAKACSDLCEVTYQACLAGRTPITIGGDHSIAMGSVAGVSKAACEQQKKIAVIWFDAHADLNTPDSSPSGNIHGMPLSALLGDGFPELVKIGGDGPKVDPKNVALIGIRTLDAEERKICKESGIHYYTMREIDEQGMGTVMRDAISKVTSDADTIHVSLDIDAIDPQYAPGVSTPETGGLSYREIHLGLEMVSDTGKLGSLDIVELNPMCDFGHKTANLAVELVQSALGKSIV